MTAAARPDVTAWTVIAAIAVYLAGVAALTIWAIPERAAAPHFTAARDLGAGTRIATVLLVAPKTETLDDKFRLRDELGRIEDRYLKRALSRGDAVTPEDVEAWPDLSQAGVIAVVLPEKADWRLYNHGTVVGLKGLDSGADQGPTRRTVVVAVVSEADGTTIALLCETDLDGKTIDPPKATPALTIEGLKTADVASACGAR